MRGKKPAAKRKRDRSKLRRRLPPEVLKGVALELFGEIRRALSAYGVSSAEQRQLFGEARRMRPVKGMSWALLEQFRRLGDLLSAWLEELPYVDARGKPKVLAIDGPGATFASLAMRYLPDKPLREVIALACRSANVGELPGDRIALYGDTMVNFSKTPEFALAQTVLHIKHVIDTCLHNVKRAPEDSALPRLERLVSDGMSEKDFAEIPTLDQPTDS